MSSPDEEASISIPSIAFVTILGFLIYRYFFSSGSPSTSSTPARTTPRFTPAQVDQVAAMFPQLDRRDIMWDLHRNRGSVQATTNRILGGGRLEVAPQTFQPTLPASTSTSNSGSTTSTIYTPFTKVIEPDLITRYNLQGRVGSSDKGKEKEEPTSPSHGWAGSKDERQEMLRRRRDDMILAARRKMQERDGMRGGGGGGGGD